MKTMASIYHIETNEAYHCETLVNMLESGCHVGKEWAEGVEISVMDLGSWEKAPFLGYLIMVQVVCYFYELIIPIATQFLLFRGVFDDLHWCNSKLWSTFTKTAQFTQIYLTVRWLLMVLMRSVILFISFTIQLLKGDCPPPFFLTLSFIWSWTMHQHELSLFQAISTRHFLLLWRSLEAWNSTEWHSIRSVHWTSCSEMPWCKLTRTSSGIACYLSLRSSKQCRWCLKSNTDYSSCCWL